MIDTEAMQLPAGTHATVLAGRDVVTGEDLAYPVVWADRSYGACRRCAQPVAWEVDCPVVLNVGAGQGGAIEPLSQQHGCGEWLSVDWTELDQGASEADVVAAAGRLAAGLAAEIDTARASVRAGLCRDLEGALARLAEPLGEGETPEDRAEEVCSGSDTGPGVYCEGGRWVAWDYDPAGIYRPDADSACDTITVTVEDLTTGGAR